MMYINEYIIRLDSLYLEIPVGIYRAVSNSRNHISSGNHIISSKQWNLHKQCFISYNKRSAQM